jgi:hypothetical protein
LQAVSDHKDDNAIVDSGSDTNEIDWSQPMDANFDLAGPNAADQPTPNMVDDEEDQQPTSAAADLLQHHHRFGHASFRRLKEMAKQGTIPKRLANCPAPACSACSHAKAIRQQWRHRTPNNKVESQRPTKPGERVSVDQMASPTPGLIAQLTGKITMKRCLHATMHADQASRLGFVWLQKTATADETIEGKIAFKKHALDRGAKVLNHHADNGMFRANKWAAACRSQGQGLSFVAANAHHQNGMAERRIGELQGLARTMLIHANMPTNDGRKSQPQICGHTQHAWPMLS